MGNQTSVSGAGEAGGKLTVSRSTGTFPFSPRDAHCSCALGQRVFVFGGVVHDSPGQITEVNDLLIFDTATQSWSKAVCKGDIPVPCSAAALSAVGDKLYLFGGLSHELGWLDTLHVYNTETGEWKLVETEGSRPSPRDKLAAAVIGTNIYYFGGFGPTQEEEELTESEEEDAVPDQEGAVFGWFNDLFFYDTVNNKWTQPMQMNLGVPTPRAAHTMCPVGKKLIIFGGKDAEGRQNDLHIFNVETRKWEAESRVGGAKPEARSFHAAAAVGNRVIVTGGRNPDNSHLADLHVFNTELSCWQQPPVTGDLPTGRGLHSCVVAGDHVVLFGGSANIDPETNQCKDIYTDTYLIKTDDILKSTDKQNGH